MAEEENELKEKKSLAIKALPYLFIALISVVLTVYVVRLKPEFFGLSKGSQQTQAEVDKVVSSVSRLMSLPEDEKPTVATVTDSEKIKDQVFFKNSKNGDKVLIYPKAQKAILYRPSENRIVEVGAVNIDQGNQQVKTEASPSPEPSTTPEEKTK
jgi:hypothetical protein